MIPLFPTPAGQCLSPLQTSADRRGNVTGTNHPLQLITAPPLEPQSCGGAAEQRQRLVRDSLEENAHFRFRRNAEAGLVQSL